MTVTTIRVDSVVRDQINELATKRGVSAGSLIQALLVEHLERELMAEVRRKMTSMTPAEKADYEAEVAFWDSTASDGLELSAGEWAHEWKLELERHPELQERFGKP